MEVTFRASGRLLDIEHTAMATYVAVTRPDGTMFGEGRGTLTTVNGSSATFVAQGAGRPTGPGAVSWRGALYVQTTAPELSQLNGIAVLYEFDSDESGKTKTVLFAWN